MRAGWVSGLLTAPLVLCAGASHSAAGIQPVAAETAEDAADEVRLAERDWLDAYERHDAAAMAKLLAPGFVITYPGGRRLTRDDVLRQVAASAGRTGMRFRTEGVTVHGVDGTIVLTGTLVGQGSRGEFRQIYTDTWIRTAGAWQVLASHLAEAPAPRGVQAE